MLNGQTKMDKKRPNGGYLWPREYWPLLGGIISVEGIGKRPVSNLVDHVHPCASLRVYVAFIERLVASL